MMRMRKVVAEEYGTADMLSVQPMEPAEPGPGEVRIAVRTAAVSYVDTLILAGRYQVRPPLPFTPGAEYAGVVDAVGPGVETVRVGDRVCGSGMGGGWADSLVELATKLVPLPEGMDFVQGAAFKVGFSTACHALVQRANLQPGERVLVLGASGSLGHASIQIAKALGASVIAAASGSAKQEFVRQAGADHVVDLREDGWREEVKALTEGRGLDVIVDPLGRAVSEPAFRLMGWGGRHLVLGFAAGSIPALPINLPLLKGASLVGVEVRQFRQRSPELAQANQQRIFDWYREGRIEPAVGRTFPLEEYREALTAARDDAAGRVVLRL